MRLSRLSAKIGEKTFSSNIPHPSAKKLLLKMYVAKRTRHFTLSFRVNQLRFCYEAHFVFRQVKINFGTHPGSSDGPHFIKCRTLV